MDNTLILIIICSLLLIAYLFDLTSRLTRIPSVILLLALGWIMNQFSKSINLQVPDMSSALPILGTVGLILIVLEGTLDLEFNKSKIPVLKKAALGALFSMVVLSALIALMLCYDSDYSFKKCLINAIPICVISSSIAIPSVRHFSPFKREFIIYESSLSDIAGVTFFNFIALNEVIDGNAFAFFGLELLIITAVSIIATALLSFLMNKIENHIKFVPIILLILLIYSISKLFHMPALVFILIFGLIIGNVDELKKLKWMERFKPESLQPEVDKFKELVTESTFLVRTLFFLLFGFLLETDEILNPDTALLAVVITITIFAIRGVQLYVSRINEKPLIFIAPRGLITILLFLSVSPEHVLPEVNKSLITQIIILTAVMMMIGMMVTGSDKKDENPDLMDSTEIPEITEAKTDQSA